MGQALAAFPTDRLGLYTITDSRERAAYSDEIFDVFHNAGWTVVRGKAISKVDADYLGLDSGPLMHSGVTVIAAEGVNPEPAISALAAGRIPHQIVNDLRNQARVFYDGGIDKSMLIFVRRAER